MSTDPWPEEAYAAARSDGRKAAATAPAPYKPPPKWERDPAWYSTPSPHPAWVKSFIATRELPRCEDGTINQARGVRPEGWEQDQHRLKTLDAAHRELRRLKSEAVIAWRHNGEGTALRRAATHRMWEVDEERDRINAEYRLNRLIHLREFVPLDMGAAQLLEKDKKLVEPLFDARAAAAGAASDDFDDLTDVIGG